MNIVGLLMICLVQAEPAERAKLPLIGPFYGAASAESARVLIHDSGRYESLHIRDAIGIKVKVEGLAWGFDEKGYGGPHMLIDGATIQMTGLDDSKHNGRLLRVTGTIKATVIKAAPPGYQGIGSDSLRIFVEPSSIEVIDCVTMPWLKQTR